MLIIKYKGIPIKVLVDNVFLPEFLKYKWYLSGGYVVRNRLKSDPKLPKLISLHSQVFKLLGQSVPKNKVIDHINRNKLDNRLENLRRVSQSDNVKNISEENLKAKKQRMSSLSKLGLNRGIAHAKSKPVIDLESGIVYDCVRAAAEAWSINYSTLRYKLQNPIKNNTCLRYVGDS